MNELSARYCLAPLILLALIYGTAQPVGATRTQQTARLPGAECDRERALDLVRQQIAEVKLIEDEVARISLLLRVADLLWPAEQETARSLLTEAYELAARNYRQKGEVMRREGAGLVSVVPDQRFVVISAVARRDPAWAQKLAQRALDEKEREAEEDATPSNLRSAPGQKLIEVALSLLPGQKPAAVEFARRSLSYPATMNELPHFLFSLAAVDQSAADEFYAEALNAYAQAGTVGQLLYLAAYAFALNRAAGPDATSVWYNVPPQFIQNAALQRAFLQALIARARRIVQSPAQTAIDSNELSEAAQIYLALNKLEPLAARLHPALTGQLSEIKVLLGSQLSVETEREVAKMWRREQDVDTKTFSSIVESIEREPNQERKDHLIVKAIQTGVETETLDELEDLAHKVGDAKVRDQLFNWLYFRRAQKAAKEGSLEEATKLAKMVAELDQRAYLFFEIAEASVKQLKDSARARETLNEVALMAQKAPNTAEKARALLGIMNLYVRYDQARAFEVMSEAVRTINRLQDQDFTRAVIIQKIEAPKWSTYFSFNVAGFRLENTFRELGPKDFDLALDLARGLENRSLRATAVIALSAPCLEKPQKKVPAGKPKGRGPRALSADRAGPEHL